MTATADAAGHYQSFIVSTYATQGTVQRLMSGGLDCAESWSNLTRNLKIDKIYLEVMRNHTLVDEAGLEKLKKFYEDEGVLVCGGLAYSVSEANGYQGFDYDDPENRAFAKRAAEMAARHFDEILLDDYFFFDRKTDYDIKAKGRKSWTQYRLETMREVAKDLIVTPAKAVNPKCKVIIKMANWYDQYAGMGNDTEKVPLIADGMFSGTESRLWAGQEQHLQPYLSYDIMRFMDNLKPGVNKGGWVDQGGAVPIDRYSEQLLDTVFARCPEMCCFNYSGMLNAIRPFAVTNRIWASQSTSLNLADVLKTLPVGDQHPTFADIAAYTLGAVDRVLVNVGKPIGIKTYTPYHATGEEFLHDYLGMIGLPMDILPQFPTNAGMVLLTEQAKADPKIIQKIKAQLQAGQSVCVTSGFLRAMKGKGIEDVCEVEATGASVPVRKFTFASGPGAPFRVARGSGRSGAAQMEGAPDPFEAARDILIPEIKYFNILTHDAWGDALGISPGGTTYPIILSCDYSKGKFYVLNIPNDPADLYAFPPSVLAVIRATLGSAEPIRIDNAPAQVALFRYDNNTFIVQNYLPAASEVTVSVAGKAANIHDLVSGRDIAPAPAPEERGFGRVGAGFGGRTPATAPPRTLFAFTLLPHSYMAFAVQ
ncbi:MAG TPA: hypothetical protein VL970_09460 [Candidatus Acidoferrales bacterium]|nr:hypothetical protein [Candidatus Acidoferrales bacterium]